jgi:hypothetical protein
MIDIVHPLFYYIINGYGSISGDQGNRYLQKIGQPVSPKNLVSLKRTEKMNLQWRRFNIFCYFSTLIGRTPTTENVTIERMV